MGTIQATANKGGTMKTQSQLFKEAHAMVKRTIQPGDDYAATFGQCYKLLLKRNAQPAKSTASVDWVSMVGCTMFLLPCLVVLAAIIGSCLGLSFEGMKATAFVFTCAGFYIVLKSTCFNLNPAFAKA